MSHTQPSEAPALHIPAASATVNVSIIDSGARMNVPSAHLVTPSIPEHRKILSIPTFSFLVEHPATSRKVLFDLGLRKDVSAMPPSVQRFLPAAGWEISVEKDVPGCLEENGISTNDIEAVIFSHHHFDHVGDLTRFPAKTKFLVGSGFKSAYLPGWPSDSSSTLLQSEWEGRLVEELPFYGESSLQIGGFEAIDYFNDGSFYLLNAPGHTVGHAAALARVTSYSSEREEDTFVFLGGDICHYPGTFRPTEWRPLKQEYASSVLSKGHQSRCPGSALQEIHPKSSCKKPFFQIPEAAAVDMCAAQDSMRNMCQFDANDNVLVIIAHDETMLEHINFFPETINAWKENGYGEKVQWSFLRDFDGL